MAYSVFYANYTIGPDAYDNVVSICQKTGKKILLIGGKKALEAGKSLLEDAIAGSNLQIVKAVVFGSECTQKNISHWAEYAKQAKVDMIFGMGGGKALDTTKCAANLINLPVFTFPTIASTCAASSALSVVYKDDGSFDRFDFFESPANHCFIHTKIIANAPVKYLQAGIGDTIGKYFECHFSARGDQLDHSSALGREISNMCYFPLLEHGVLALSECQENQAGHALEQSVLAIIISTGLVSMLVLDQYNCAVAHSVYYGLVLLPGFEEHHLHGNVVAYGVLVQLAIDGDWKEFEKVKEFLVQLKIASTLEEMGVSLNKDQLKDVLHEIVTGPDMEHIPYEITEDMVYEGLQKTEMYGRN